MVKTHGHTVNRTGFGTSVYGTSDPLDTNGTFAPIPSSSVSILVARRPLSVEFTQHHGPESLDRSGLELPVLRSSRKWSCAEGAMKASKLTESQIAFVLR